MLKTEKEQRRKQKKEHYARNDKVIRFSHAPRKLNRENRKMASWRRKNGDGAFVCPPTQKLYMNTQTYLVCNKIRVENLSAHIRFPKTTTILEHLRQHPEARDTSSKPSTI